MAIKLLRPGPWKLVSSSGLTEKVRIDYEVFQIPAGGSIEFQVERMASFDDTNMVEYRTPASPQTIVSNTGSKSVSDSFGQKDLLTLGGTIAKKV